MAHAGGKRYASHEARQNRYAREIFCCYGDFYRRPDLKTHRPHYLPASTSTITIAAIINIAPTSLHTSTRAPRCCSRVWKPVRLIPQTATTLHSPREL